MRRTWLAVGAVVLLAAFAAADAVRDGDEERVDAGAATGTGPAESGLRGSAVPPPGTLPGRLLFTRASDCSVQALDLATVRLDDAGDAPGCELWVSPDGTRAVAAGDTRRGGRAVMLVDVRRQADTRGEIGATRGPPTWAPDSDRVGWCTPEGLTLVYSVARERTVQFAGCNPVFAPDGNVLTTPPEPLEEELLRNGQAFVSAGELGRPAELIGYAQSRTGLLALALLPGGADATAELQLWRNRRLGLTITLPEGAGRGALGEIVRFSPDGSEIAVAGPGAGARVAVFDVRTGERTLAPTRQVGFDWSRAGAWLAVSTGVAIEIYGTGRDAPVYALPLAAASIAWR
jgi:hypothetical protein